jgi:hypothetical protein
MMRTVLTKIFGSKQPPMMDTQLSKILLDIGPEKTDEKFDGWYDFIHDTVASIKRQKDAFEWVKNTGGAKYDHALWKAIASHMYFRTKRHPDLDAIKQLDYDAVTNCNYETQLAYNCMIYEEELLTTPDHVALATLKEMTASIV